MVLHLAQHYRKVRLCGDSGLRVGEKCIGPTQRSPSCCSALSIGSSAPGMTNSPVQQLPGESSVVQGTFAKTAPAWSLAWDLEFMVYVLGFGVWGWGLGFS